MKTIKFRCKECLEIKEEIPIRGITSCFDCYTTRIKKQKHKNIWKLTKRLLKINIF